MLTNQDNKEAAATAEIAESKKPLNIYIKFSFGIDARRVDIVSSVRCGHLQPDARNPFLSAERTGSLPRNVFAKKAEENRHESIFHLT